MTLTPSAEQSAILEGGKTSSTSIFIHAGAGCAKTTSLVMLSKVLPRSPACVLVFNKKIQEELKTKFPSHYEVMTFNSLGHKAVARMLGSTRPELKPNKLSELLRAILQNEGGFILPGDKFQQVIRLCTFAMQEGLVPEEFQKEGFIDDTPEAWDGLAHACELDLSEEQLSFARTLLIWSIREAFKGKISFDDQIYISVFFAKPFFPRFGVCLVDEAQDLSPLNREMIKYTCPTGRLVIVGDDKQSIYGFRGADVNSFQNLRALRESWLDFPLLTTFRCPKSVVSIASRYATGYRANSSNPEGRILDLTKAESWCIGDYTSAPSIAVLCRNNAPLLTFAFSCLSHGIPCEYLGRDIGKSLERLVKSIAGSNLSQSREDFLTRLQNWEIKETAKYVNNSDSIQDRCDSIRALFGTNHKDVHSVLNQIQVLANMDHGKLTLATGHKAKGLEWHTVIHLDPWRVPSKFAEKKGGSFYIQDLNVKHVITTRTQDTLILANLKEHFFAEELKNYHAFEIDKNDAPTDIDLI
jgi:hypothetical protein